MAILRGAEEACSTSDGLREVVAQLRAVAAMLRTDSAELRSRAGAVRRARRA